MMEKKKNSEKNEEVINVNLQAILLLLVILLIIIAVFIYINTKNVDNIKNNIVEQNTSVTNTTEEISFNEENAINLLKEYLELKSIATSNPQALLEKYGYATNQQFSNYEKTADEAFIKTDIIYEDIRNELQKYITKDFFNKEYKNIYKSSNGITYVANKNAPKVSYNVTRFERIETKNKPVLQVWYKTTTDGVTSEEKNMKVEYTTNNSKWIISNIN